MTSQFFDEKRAAAILKHGILKRYLHVFCSKSGHKSEGHRVVYLDGYAGPGTYTDGQPGSPALAVATAEKLADVRELFGIYVEEDPGLVQRLEKTLDGTAHQYRVLKGSLQEHLSTALSLVKPQDPLFAFVDPFGLPVPLVQLVEIMGHADFRDGFRCGPPTEMLLNFSHAGLRRNAGHLTASSDDDVYLKARETTLSRLDATLGGDWWRPLWESGVSDRINQIATEYMNRLAREADIQGWYRVPVRRTLGGPVVYDLMFFTHYPEEGLWHFNECVSLALEDYYEFCTRYELDLDPKADRDARWVEDIQANIQRILIEEESFRLWDRHRDVYGESLGYAREKHLRKAIKALYRDGQIDHNGQGDLKGAVIRRGGD